MKKIYLFTTIALLFFSLNINANEENDFEEVHVSVNGLVCDFCAQSVEKLFKKEKAVQDIDVDLKMGMVTILIKSDAIMDDIKITELITQSGYSVEGIHRVQ
jgi:copper chaperone CopZ